MKSTAFAGSTLSLVLTNVAITGIARGAETAGDLYIALHTADPGAAGTQATSEVSYTGYARETVARSTDEWTITGNAAVNDNPVTFGQRTNEGTATATYVSIGLSSGAILYRGELTTPLAITQNVTPSFAAGELAFTEE